MQKRCKHLGCSGYGQANGYCPNHLSEFVPRVPFQGAVKTTGATAYYHTTEWRKFSRDYLAKHKVCVLCGRASQATDHHLMSAPTMIKTFGKFVFDERYYRALCHSCNTKERNRKYRKGGTP